MHKSRLVFKRKNLNAKRLRHFASLFFGSVGEEDEFCALVLQEFDDVSGQFVDANDGSPCILQFAFFRFVTLMRDTDILISAPSAPNSIICKSDINPNHRLLAIDLAFPRDIEPDITEIEGVTLYNLHDVEQKVKDNISIREDEIKKAEALIEEEIAELQDIMERRKLYMKNS